MVKIKNNPVKGRKCSRFESDFIKDIKKIIKEQPGDICLKLGEIMERCKIPYDPIIIHYNNKVSQIFQKHRKKMKQKLTDFVIIGEYYKLLESGLNEKEIFIRFRDYCVSWDVIPVYSDKHDDYRYHLLTLPEWMKMIDKRVMLLGQEYKNKIDTLKEAMTVFPKETNKQLRVVSHKPDELKDYLLGEGKDE